jgi:hypothetical protein
MGKICKLCGNAFETKDKRRKFCSMSCSAKFNNKGVTRHRKIPKSRICEYCKCEFVVTQKNRSNKFCPRCIDNRVYNRQFVYSGLKTDKGRKLYLIEEYGHRCSVCNNTTWMGKPISLELDHLDGNHTNNDKKNVRLICPNCHAQTGNYKGKNRGNGREWRRLRYKEIFGPLSIGGDAPDL